MSDKELMDSQALLIHKVRGTLSSNISLADELADLLGISTDSAYRRIRGETALTIGEAIAICDRFKISLDSLGTPHEGAVSFNYREVDGQNFLENYLADIRDDMLRISKASQKSILYAAVDVPIFHYFKFPIYFYFKMFYWLRSVTNDPEYISKKFSVNDISPELKDLCNQLADLYSMVPSAELWSDSILLSVIKQIKYYWLSGIFDTREDCFLLIDAIRKTLEMVQHEAEMDMKLLLSGHTSDLVQNFKLYQSDIEIGNNFILVTIGNLKILYNSFHTYNKMFTTNPYFCELTETWMNHLVRQANLISGVAEKQRFQFFRKMYCQLDALSESIEKGTVD